jgi:hypothetical protein
MQENPNGTQNPMIPIAAGIGGPGNNITNNIYIYK